MTTREKSKKRVTLEETNENKKKQIASEISEVLNLKSNAEDIFKQMIGYSLKNETEEVSREAMERISKLLTFDSVINHYVGLYCKYYNLKELKDLLKFYKSATGKKFVESSFSMAKESSAYIDECSQSMFTDKYEEVLEIVKDVLSKKESKQESFAQDILQRRFKFAKEYAKDKGWNDDLVQLTNDQWQEIRSQSEWGDF